MPGSDGQRLGATGKVRVSRDPGFLRNAMIDSTTAILVVVFAFQLSGSVPAFAIVGASYVLSILLGAVTRWGIAVYLFPPGSLAGDPEPPSRNLS